MTLEYTAFGIPTISPYVLEMPYTLGAFNPNSVINFISNNPEVTVYGCETFKVSHMM